LVLIGGWMMARSKLRESQWRDEDVLSEAEYAALNGLDYGDWYVYSGQWWP